MRADSVLSLVIVEGDNSTTKPGVFMAVTGKVIKQAE
jgi:hypothetical protein